MVRQASGLNEEQAREDSEDISNSVDDLLEKYAQRPFLWLSQHDVIFTTGQASKFIEKEFDVTITPAKIRDLDERLQRDTGRPIYRRTQGAISVRYYTRAEARRLVHLAA